MIGSELSVRVVSNRLTGQLQADLRSQVAKAVHETLLDVQDDWAADVRVDTGELQASLDEPIAIQLAPDGMSGSVGTSVGHAEVNEYGGPTIAARPSARQAAERNRRPFEQRVRRAIEGR